MKHKESTKNNNDNKRQVSWHIPETLGWGGWDGDRQIPRAGCHNSQVGW